MTATLDVDCLMVTRHALDRYIEKRGGGRNRDMAFADRKLRELLRKAEGKSSPIFLTQGRAVRRYVTGGFAFITSADNSTLITVYPFSPAAPQSHGGSRRARHGRRPMRSFGAVDEYEEEVA